MLPWYNYIEKLLKKFESEVKKVDENVYVVLNKYDSNLAEIIVYATDFTEIYHLTERSFDRTIQWNRVHYQPRKPV